jgi:hypothetical protein
LPADPRGRFGYNTISFAEALHPLAHACHHAGKFVTQDDGNSDGPALSVVILMKFAATHTHGARAKENLVVLEVGRYWHIT